MTGRGVMEFRVLGTLEIRDRAGRLLVPLRRKQRLLLAVLLLRANTAVSTESLLDLLWPEAAPSSARANLHSYISDLRRLLQANEPADPPRLQREPDGYQLRAGPQELDAAVFDELAGQGRQALAEGHHPLAAERLAQALAQWRGPVLEDLPVPAALQPEIERLEELRMMVLEDSVQARLDLDQPALLAAELAELTARHPLRERLWAHLMLALYQAGRQGDALDAYQRVYRLLDQELAVRPGQALQRLHQRILTADPTLAPPAAAATHTPRRVRQLPAPPPMFTGRIREVATLDRSHDASTVVISAIDGMAGIGKTALAVHLAHRIADRYPDGQLFVDLHGHTPGMAPREPAQALDHLLRALGVPGPQIPANLEDRAALYRTRLADRRMLVLLDDAATEAQVAPLLPGSAGCLVLITSRRRLAGLDRTQTLTLDTLPAPDAADLFVQTAGDGRLGHEPPDLVAELVELCGRLPLAIRIAAARLRSHPAWPLVHLVRRLRDQRSRLGELEAGQRSVTATLDLSYQHLTPHQQHAYRRLGMHPGPDIDVYATAALLDSTLPHAGRMLDQLLEVHLLQELRPGRYRFHDLIRAHAARTAARDQTRPARHAASNRLLDYYRHTAALAVDAAYPYEREHRPEVPPASTPGPDVHDPPAALVWLDNELTNLLAVAAYTAEYRQSEHVLHLSTILHWHLRSRGLYHDAETLHHQALTTARATGDHAGELDARAYLGQIHRLLGRFTQATDHLEQALRIARVTDRHAGVLEALTGLGHIHWRQGRYSQAADYYQQALRIARDTDHRSGELEALTGLGRLHWMQGQPAQAADHFGQALRIARATGHRLGELNALTGLGHVHQRQGRYSQAADHFQEALRVAWTTGQRVGELSALTGLSQVQRRQRRHEQATQSYLQLLDLARKAGDRNYEFEARQGLGRLSHTTGDPEAAIAHHQQALVLANELGQPVDQARAHDGLAHAHHTRGRHEQAHEHWQNALDILTDIDLDRTDDEETTTAAIRAHLAAVERAG
ncbi:tetratricopeptide repeat protein [Phytohabitans sp. ZYX-F-186]|uniref:Tetratricopeptide repeat protein n=1 Tax=Phytohabitans maris TaxID=3071409 RepID=A0ABU0ZE84_9ACTN|nr:tetratricopeptide repeat protein [Phytohabitans sp. ZYX-F-186]MDQ7905369.1 tetratricopeptide repeat protein [Phytohabitans sp. ZYX-F-186]